MPPQDQRMMLPSSQGGLVRYFDEYKSKYQMKPSHVLVLAAAIIVIEILMHTFAPSAIIPGASAPVLP